MGRPRGTSAAGTAAAPDGGVGQLSRRILSGMGSAGCVGGRSPLAAASQTCDARRSHALAGLGDCGGGVGAESQRLPHRADPELLPRQLSHVEAAGVGPHTVVAPPMAYRTAGGSGGRAAVGAKASADLGLAAVRRL